MQTQESQKTYKSEMEELSDFDNDEDEIIDDLMDIVKAKDFKRRFSVSAEVYGAWNKREKF